MQCQESPGTKTFSYFSLDEARARELQPIPSIHREPQAPASDMKPHSQHLRGQGWQTAQPQQDPCSTSPMSANSLTMKAISIFNRLGPEQAPSILAINYITLQSAEARTKFPKSVQSNPDIYRTTIPTSKLSLTARVPTVKQGITATIHRSNGPKTSVPAWPGGGEDQEEACGGIQNRCWS